MFMNYLLIFRLRRNTWALKLWQIIHFDKEEKKYDNDDEKRLMR